MGAFAATAFGVAEAPGLTFVSIRVVNLSIRFQSIIVKKVLKYMMYTVCHTSQV